MELIPQPPRWFVARTRPRQEMLAAASLRAESLDAYLPLFPQTNRKGEIYATALFPGFLFVRLSLGQSGWTKVFSARGVSSVLGTGGKPSALADFVVDQIHAREVAAFIDQGLDAPQQRRFDPGEIVRFAKGPLARLEAIFVEMVDSKRCQVLIQMLGEPRLALAEMAHVA